MRDENDITQQYGYLENIVDQALSLVHLSKSVAEILIVKTTGITVSTRYGKVENVEFNNHGTLDINVFHKQCKGSAISNDLSKKGVICTVKSAINISRYTFQDLFSGIAEKDLLAFHSLNLDLFHPISLDVSLGVNLAAEAEQIALEYDKRIIYTEGGKFHSYLTTRVFGNSHGMVQSYSTSQYFLSCSVVAESNGIMEQNYAYTFSRSFNNLKSTKWVGQECARRTLAHLNPKKIKTTECPVIFSSEVATTLFSHLAHAIHGNNIYRKSTFLLNDIGKKIFPAWISIKEYPHILQGLGSAPFDSEGVKTSNRVIVKNGVLNSWLLNSYSARKIGLKNTGHSDGIYNWIISYKNISFEELIQNMYRGLIITDIMGQGVNIITGDYSRGISGFWVENGEIQYPVNEVTVAGNLKKMFQNIDSISNDIEDRNNIRCGSVLISSIQIAGI